MNIRRILLAAVVAILVTACGGDGGSGESEPDTETTTTQAPPVSEDAPETDDGGGEEPTDDSPGAGSATESVALVTIDGNEYQFGANGPAATCDPDFFGGFFAVLYSSDLSQSFNVELWPEGSNETTSGGMVVFAPDGTELDLEADPEREFRGEGVGSTFIDPFTIDGSTATGTGTFINTDSVGDFVPVIAEFQVTCAEE